MLALRGDRLRRTIRPGLGVAMIACSLSACTDPPMAVSRASTSTQATTSGGGAVLDLPVLVSRVDAFERANQLRGVVRLAAGAHAAVLQHEAPQQAMVMRDEDATTWEAGTYRLRVACAGQGSLSVTFAVGAQVRDKQLPPCRPDISTDQVDLVLPRATAHAVVQITPVGNTWAAVAYRVVKQ